MGWTHHWEREIEFPTNQFTAIVDDCKTVFANIDVKLAGCEGRGKPVFSETAIIFNGVGGMSCEDFVIQKVQFPSPGRDYVICHCKTEHLPYDICVKAALVILKHHLRDHIRVMSDGKKEDWAEAINICKSCVGYGDDFVLADKD